MNKITLKTEWFPSGISIGEVEDTPSQMKFKIHIDSYTEDVIINMPPHRYSSILGYAPIVRHHNGRIYAYSIDGHTIGSTRRDSKTGEITSTITPWDTTEQVKEEVLSALGVTEWSALNEETIDAMHPDRAVLNFSQIDRFSYYTLGEALTILIVEIAENVKATSRNNISITMAIQEFMNGQMTKYLRKDISEAKREIDEIDIADKVILPEFIRNNHVVSEYLVMNDSPQSEDSGRVVHLAMDTHIVSNKLRKMEESVPILMSRTQATNAYHRHTYSNRSQVRRGAVTQSADLLESDEPIVEGKYDRIKQRNSRNLHVCFMNYGYTDEDGIVISETVSEKLKVIHRRTETVKSYLPIEFDITPCKMEFSDITAFRQIVKANPDSVMRPHGIIGIEQATDLIEADTKNFLDNLKSAIANGEPITVEHDQEMPRVVRTKSKSLAIVTAIDEEEIEQYVSTETGIKKIQMHQYTISSVSVSQCGVGDKLMGYYHGNKGTVSIVLPDKAMPKFNGIPVDIIFQPKLAKRGMAIVRELSDTYCATIKGKKLTVDPMKPKKICYDGIYDHATVGKNLHTKDAVLHGTMRIVRLEHHADHKLSYSAYTQDMKGRGSIVLPGAQHIFMEKGAMGMLEEVLSNGQKSRAKLEEYMKVLEINYF